MPCHAIIIGYSLAVGYVLVIWTFQHDRWLTGGTCCFGLGRAPQNVGLNFHENLKIVKKF